MSSNADSEDEFACYLSYRSALEQIQREFNKFAAFAPNLYHREFLSRDDPLDSRSWSAFIEANRIRDNWERWEPSQDGWTCGCYFGESKHLEHFQRLAESGYSVLRQLKFRIDRDLPVPPKVKIQLPLLDGHLGWLDLLHDTADFGATLLSERLGYWKFPGNYLESDVPESYDHFRDSTGDCRYPSHPLFRELQHDVLLSSARAIDVWLLADQAISTGDYCNDSPIALPNIKPHVSRSSAPEPTPPEDEQVKPTWDAKLKQLRLGVNVIRQYKNPAADQAGLLSAFEEKGWPEVLDDPLGIADKKTKAEKIGLKNKRRNLVCQLNEGQNHIQFLCGGTGLDVRWMWRKARSDPEPLQQS